MSEPERTIQLINPAAAEFGYVRHDGKFYKVLSVEGEVYTCRELTEREETEMLEKVRVFLQRDFEGESDE